MRGVKNGKVVPCAYCGKEVYKQAKLLAISANSYCSVQCRALGEIHRKITGEWHDCANPKCSEKVWRTPADIRDGVNRFCNRECFFVWYSNRETDAHDTHLCENCGKEFKRLKSREKYGAGRYCSRSCAEQGRKGENHPQWQGGRQKRGDGYIDIASSNIPPEYASMKREGGRVFEHRLVAAIALGRPLEEWEVVHHKNGDRSDNSPTNLEVHNPFEHNGVTHSENKEIRRLKKEVEMLKRDNDKLRKLLLKLDIT